LVGELNYVGTHSSHLNVLADLNQPFFTQPEVSKSPDSLTRSPISGTSNIRGQSAREIQTDGGDSGAAHAHGVGLRFVYTYSRSIDNAPQELESNSARS